jgi:hypothetical protein
MAILQKGYSVTIVLAIIAFCGVRDFILLYFCVKEKCFKQDTKSMKFELIIELNVMCGSQQDGFFTQIKHRQHGYTLLYVG